MTSTSTRVAFLAFSFAVPALLAMPAAAAPIFEFEISGTFSNAEINDVPISEEFVITGQTLTTGHSGVPGEVNPVEAPLDTSAISLSYGGNVVATELFLGQATYDLLGAAFFANPAPVFEFSGTDPDGIFDIKPKTTFDSIIFEFTLEGVTTWLGFGGEGRNMGITINQDDDGVVLFGQSDWLTRPLLRGDNTRTASYTPAPIPLPAAAWLLIAALGGLGVVSRRRST